MNDRDHEYHDHFTKQIILQSDIPAILAKHHISLEKVLQKENYYLLENTLPDISVDRFDYFMRDAYIFKLLPLETITLFLEKIKERNERFYFEDVEIASLFSLMFMNCSRLIWLDPTSHGSFFLLSEAIKIALEKKIMTKEDFFLTDDVVMQKLKDAKNDAINQLLKRLQPGTEFVYAPKALAEFYGPNKPRFVDPWIMKDNQLIHLSDIIPGLTYYFQEFKAAHTYVGVKQK